MKCGFTLIEVLIATAVASILSTALFFSYAQINKIFVSTKNYIDQYETILLLQHQLSKDLSGAFIPVQATSPKEQKQPKEQQTKHEQDKQAQPKEQVQSSPPSEPQTKKAPVLKDPFISKNREKNIQMLSFVTNNATRVFVGKKTGEVKSNTARVVYTLEQDKNSSKDVPVYVLYRQEGSDLNLSHYTKADSAIERYPLAHNIKAWTLTFEVLVEQEDKDAKATKQSSKEAKKEIKQFSDWLIGKDEKDVRAQAKLPHKATFTCVLWNDKRTTEQEFIFTVVVMAAYHELPSIQPLKQSPAQPATNNQASPAIQNPADQRKQQLVSGANRVVNNIRTLLGA